MLSQDKVNPPGMEPVWVSLCTAMGLPSWFWLVFCFKLVHLAFSQSKRTNSTHFIPRGFHGSTQTGRRHLVHLARRRHGAGHACWFCIFGARHLSLIHI